MLEDFTRTVNVLLQHGFIEADNRLDEYSESVDSLKITGYGLYMFNGLAYTFTYLDLVCTDTGLFEESVANYLVEAAKTEYGFFTRNQRVQRVETRLERVEQFVSYLEREEKRERDAYGLAIAEEDLFTFKCRETFENERARVLSSARRQEAKPTSRSARSGRGARSSRGPNR